LRQPYLLEVGALWDGSPCRADERVRLVLQFDPDGWRVHVDAPFHGDPAPEEPPGPLMGLWNYEVVELFVVGLAPADKPVPYTEIELGPHGHHLVLKLEGVRNPVKTELPLAFTADVRGRRWHGEALLPFHLLPARPVRMNAYAIHGQGDDRRYLAMTAVPGDTPDFHRLECFGKWIHG